MDEEMMLISELYFAEINPENRAMRAPAPDVPVPASDDPTPVPDTTTSTLEDVVPVLDVRASVSVTLDSTSDAPDSTTDVPPSASDIPAPIPEISASALDTPTSGSDADESDVGNDSEDGYVSISTSDEEDSQKLKDDTATKTDSKKKPSSGKVIGSLENKPIDNEAPKTSTSGGGTLSSGIVPVLSSSDESAVAPSASALSTGSLSSSASGARPLAVPASGTRALVPSASGPRAVGPWALSGARLPALLQSLQHTPRLALNYLPPHIRMWANQIRNVNTNRYESLEERMSAQGREDLIRWIAQQWIECQQQQHHVLEMEALQQEEQQPANDDDDASDDHDDHDDHDANDDNDDHDDHDANDSDDDFSHELNIPNGFA